MFFIGVLHAWTFINSEIDGYLFWGGAGGGGGKEYSILIVY